MAEIEAFDEFIQNVARDTWEVFRRDALLFVVAGAIYMLLCAVSLGILTGPLTAGFIELTRRSRAGEPGAVSTLFSRFDTFVSTFIAFLLVGIAVVVGFFLLVIPGLVAILFSTYTIHAITYEGSTAVDALKRSIDLVRKNFLHTFGLLLAIAIGQSLGGIVLFGVLLTCPLSIILLTIGFERLSAASMGHPLMPEP